MKTDNIYNVLNSYLKRSNKDSINEVICRFMISHLMEIPQMSVNEIAESCYTSHPSIIRFTKEIGFEGFSDFKYNVQDYIDEVRRKELRVRFPIETLSDETAFRSSFEDWMKMQNDFIVSSILQTDREKVKKLCEEIRDHDNVIVLGGGLSEVILELFRIMLARCGKIINNISTDIEALASYEKKDTLLIILSMNGFFLQNARRIGPIDDMKSFLKKHTDRSWLITMNRDLPDSPCDETLLIEGGNSSFELTLNGAIIFFELIGQHYQELCGK